MNTFNRIALSVLGALTLTAAATPAPPPLTKWEREHREHLKRAAPGDRYFGRLKLSFLGINNTFRDAAISAGDHTTDAAIANKVALADDALRDWSSRFPADPQLPRSYFLAIQIHKKLWIKANQEKAWLYMNRLARLQPRGYFGRLITRELASGFTEHYFADVAPCPTATPSLSPSPTPEVTVAPTPAASPRRQGRAALPAESSAPSSSPLPEPTRTGAPAPTAIPVPEATEIAKGLKVQILTPPCASEGKPSAAPTSS